MFRLPGPPAIMITPMLQGDQFTPYIVDEKDAQRGVVAGGKQRLDDGRRSGVAASAVRVKTRPVPSSQQFSYHHTGAIPRRAQGPGAMAWRKGNAAGRLISGGSTMYFMMLWARQGRPHPIAMRVSGRVVVCLDDLLVAQVETRSKGKMRREWWRKEVRMTAPVSMEGDQIPIKSGFWIVCRVTEFIANINRAFYYRELDVFQ